MSQLKWHPKTVGPLTYYQAREYFSSLGVDFKFPSIKELRDGMKNHPDEFMSEYDYWAREYCDETMHAWAVKINGDADTMKYEDYAYFRARYKNPSMIDEKKEKEGGKL